MFSFENIGNRVFAAVTSLTVTAIFLAAVIAPANHGAVLPGVIA